MPTPPIASHITIDPVSFETYDWKPRAPEMYSRSEVERQTGPYQAVVPAQIANWDPRISGEDSADIEDATRQLIEFDTLAQRTLGNDSPVVGQVTAILLRTESLLSSQIEQLPTSAKQLALAETLRYSGARPSRCCARSV